MSGSDCSIVVSVICGRTGPVQLHFEREAEIAVEDAGAGVGRGHAEICVEEDEEGDEGEAEVESEAVRGGYGWWLHSLSA